MASPVQESGLLFPHNHKTYVLCQNMTEFISNICEYRCLPTILTVTKFYGSSLCTVNSFESNSYMIDLDQSLEITYI